MNGGISKLLMTLHLLVVVALVAAVVHLYSEQTGAPGVSIDALATDTEAQGTEGGEVESDPTSTADGELEGDSFTSELKWVPASAFVPSSGATTSFNSTTGCVSKDDFAVALAAPLELPDDATMSSMTAYVHDKDGDGSVQAHLRRTNTTTIGAGNAPSSDLIFSAHSGDGDDSGYQSFFDSAPGEPGVEVIDLNTYTYSVEVVMVGGGTSFCGVRIIWRPESTTELTFHEVEPCAVFDTRAGKGGREAKLAGGQTVAFDTIMSDYSGQGGVATSCGVPAPNGGLFNNGEGTVAVMLNLVALNPASTGNLKAWDPDTTEPDGGILVYTTGENSNVVLPMAVENSTFSPTGPGEDGGDVNVKNNGGDPVDVRGVVVGYFTKPLINQE